jgi:glycosyltransferase involved in cell wall biosynthesis
MKFCVVIPCFNHPATVAAVAQSAKLFCPVIVVDDGSTQPLPQVPGCEIIRLGKNSGKGAALRAGFQRAAELGFSHAITMDADGQHFAEDLPKFLAAANAQPDALVVGVRDLAAAGCPKHRQRSNAVSTFWFRVETGVRLRDTQCGFRCYPLTLAKILKVNSGRYAFELEFMVRASWTGVPIVAVPVKCTYADGIRNSHFRPVRDLAHITTMNIGLVLQSWFVPLTLRVAWSHGEKWSLRKTVREFFAEHTEESSRLAAAVGLGLFFGIMPIYGFQIMVGAAVAHQLRLNKATLLLASHISIPPVVPFILYGSMVLGHWIFTGQSLDISPHQITKGLTLEHFVEWIVGSLALGIAVGLVGTIFTYSVARVIRRK